MIYKEAVKCDNKKLKIDAFFIKNFHDAARLGKPTTFLKFLACHFTILLFEIVNYQR
jgi:hypothetical protein